MGIESAVKLTSRDQEIIKSIFIHRGITADQLVTAIFPDKFPPGFMDNVKSKDRPSALMNMYRSLKKLMDHGLVTFKVMDDRSKLYYLTERGLEEAYDLCDIPVRHKGNGFGQDFGEFTYINYRPPLERLNHHILLVNFALRLNQYKLEQQKVDFRDNRYAAEKYKNIEKEKSRVVMFRPDGEMLLNGGNYFIEIDTGSEYQDELIKKFERYNSYFEFLESQDRSLPEAIVFVNNKSKPFALRRRWNTLFQAFVKTMQKWAHRVNIIMIPLEGVSKLLKQEINSSQEQNYIGAKLLKYYMNSPYKGSSALSFRKENGLPWDSLFTVTQTNANHHLFLYERLNSYETRGYFRILAFNEFFKEARNKFEGFEHVKSIVPVFYYSDFPITPDDRIEDIPAELLRLTDEFIWLNLSDPDAPKWIHKDETEITGNPLLIKG